LEKTRLIHQIPGERNFHIFYQLLRSNNEKLLNSLYLVPNAIESYNYTSNSTESSQIPNVSDSTEFQKVCDCLKWVCEEDLQFKIFQILAGILHLGNVFFEDQADSESSLLLEHNLFVPDQAKDAFDKTCKLLGFESEDLVNSMTKQNMYVNNNIIVKVQSLSQVRVYISTIFQLIRILFSLFFLA
jgi:myosin protein heavy chain